MKLTPEQKLSLKPDDKTLLASLEDCLTYYLSQEIQEILIESNLHSITAKSNNLTREDIYYVYIDLYVKLQRQKKYKAKTKKECRNYFFTMFNNYYRDVHNGVITNSILSEKIMATPAKSLGYRIDQYDDYDVEKYYESLEDRVEPLIDYDNVLDGVKDKLLAQLSRDRVAATALLVHALSDIGQTPWMKDKAVNYITEIYRGNIPNDRFIIQRISSMKSKYVNFVSNPYNTERIQTDTQLNKLTKTYL
jgi:hypothetical protein